MWHSDIIKWSLIHDLKLRIYVNHESYSESQALDYL